MASYSPMYWLAHRHARNPSLRPDLNVRGILGVPRPRRPWYWTEDFLPFTGDDCSEDADRAVTPYELCETCIPIRDYVQTLDLESMEGTTRTTLAHASTGQALEDSALGGCHLCTLFWQLAIRDAYQSRRYADTIPRGAGWMDYAAQIRRLTDLHISIGTWKQDRSTNECIGMLIHGGSHWGDQEPPFLLKLDRAPSRK
jgi:hypothetical protein